LIRRMEVDANQPGDIDANQPEYEHQVINL